MTALAVSEAPSDPKALEDPKGPRTFGALQKPQTLQVRPVSAYHMLS